jgi:hypothetical protein
MKVQILKGSIICRESVELKATFEAKAGSALMAIPVKPPTIPEQPLSLAVLLLMIRRQEIHNKSI